MGDKGEGLLVGFGPLEDPTEGEPSPESPDSVAEEAALDVALGKGDMAARKAALRDFIDMRIQALEDDS